MLCSVFLVRIVSYEGPKKVNISIRGPRGASSRKAAASTTAWRWRRRLMQPQRQVRREGPEKATVKSGAAWPSRSGGGVEERPQLCDAAAGGSAGGFCVDDYLAKTTMMGSKATTTTTSTATTTCMCAPSAARASSSVSSPPPSLVAGY